jgi:hypothetical protein
MGKICFFVIAAFTLLAGVSNAQTTGQGYVAGGAGTQNSGLVSTRLQPISHVRTSSCPRSETRRCKSPAHADFVQPGRGLSDLRRVSTSANDVSDRSGYGERTVDGSKRRSILSSASAAAP